MKRILTLLLILGSLSSIAQTYIIDLDSGKTMTLKALKSYKVKTEDGRSFSSELLQIENDTFFFVNSAVSYQSISAIRNPKRKNALDVILFPMTIGSCLSMSALPINYGLGYFKADTDAMFSTLALFIGESVIFAISRSYLSKNKRWINLSKLEELKVIAKP